MKRILAWILLLSIIAGNILEGSAADGICRKASECNGDEPCLSTETDPALRGENCIYHFESVQALEKHLKASTFSIVGFFSENAGAARREFLNLDKKYRKSMALVDNPPNVWLGAPQFPTWVDEHGQAPDADYAIAAYHTRRKGLHPREDMDAFFGNNSEYKKGQMSMWIQPRSNPTFGPLPSMTHAYTEHTGRCVLMFLHNSGGRQTGPIQEKGREEVLKAARKLREVSIAVTVDTVGDQTSFMAMKSWSTNKEPEMNGNENPDEYALVLLTREGLLLPAKDFPHNAAKIEEWVKYQCKTLPYNDDAWK